MANLFDSYIQDFRRINHGEDDDVIRALIAKKEEMGENVTDEEVHNIVREILTAQLERATQGAEDSSHSNGNSNTVILSEDDRQYMETTTATVKAFIESHDWGYSVKSHRPDLVTYNLSFSVKGCNLQGRIHVEADPRVCRIDAILPISADPIFEYPLCLKIAQFNYSKRFGSLKYDHRDGELMFTYSTLLTNHGIDAEDLNTLFLAVMRSGLDSFQEVRRAAVGRFSHKEVDEILTKLDELSKDLVD